MTTLTCPKCRQGMPEESLDAGQCPACGFPLDGPVVLGSPRSRGGARVLLVLVVLGVAALASYGAWEFAGDAAEQPPVEVAAAATPEPAPPVVYIAPFPREATHEPRGPDISPPQPPEIPQPLPVVIEPPKRKGPRPIGVVMKVDPKLAAVRAFDHPDDTAALPDLNSGDHVVLKGRLRALRIGSVNGNASLDATDLVAEEIVITGDLNRDAKVELHAPGGTVTARGFVFGNAKLTIVAPGGTVLFTESARVSGGAVITISAKHVSAKGLLCGGARLNITFSAGGSLKLTLMNDGATVTYRKAAPGDPPPTVEKGKLHGGARVVAQ